MRCFVTGGAGFIGSHLVDRLLQKGHFVTVFDNLSSGRRHFIQHHLTDKNFRIIQSDLLDLASVSESMRNHEVVFHLAANPDARLGIEHTDIDLKQETIATYHVLEAMRQQSVRKIVFSSSGTIYGETPVIPLSEDYGPVLPISLYGAGKVASEGLISAFCHTFDMQGWIFRFANIVGNRGTHGVIFDFIHKLKRNPHKLEILGDGTQEKPYLHVQECIDGMLFGFEHAQEKVNVFNLGCDSSTDVTTIAHMVISAMNLKNIEIQYTGGDRGWPGDVPQVRFNCDKINALGWRARYTSDEAVQMTVNALVRELSE